MTERLVGFSVSREIPLTWRAMESRSGAGLPWKDIRVWGMHWCLPQTNGHRATGNASPLHEPRHHGGGIPSL